MKQAIVSALVMPFLLACPACDDDDDGGDGGSACSHDMCNAWCEDQHASELDDCNEICGIEAYCTTDDECSCNFYPCHNPACDAWCQENYDVGGACDLLTCECF